MNIFILMFKRLTICLLALSVSGIPLASAQSTPGSNPQAARSQPAQPAADPATAPSSSDSPPESPSVPAAANQGSTQPAQLPNSPGAVQPQANPTTTPPSSTEHPLGTAAAEVGSASGNAASKPAGAAIAPGKQHQSRSLLIKLGAIIGVGVAVGTVVALSSGSPSRPPASQ